MPDIIRENIRTARKSHICDYCGHFIEAGEKYKNAVLKYDDLYTWKSHLKCSEVASELWDFIDPMDYGMSGEDFHNGCQDFCQFFVCPDCEHWDKEECECAKDEEFCVDKIHALLQTHDFRCVRDKYGRKCWKCLPKDGDNHEQG